MSHIDDRAGKLIREAQAKIDRLSGHADEGILRLPPHSIEAEQSVLGGLLIDAGAYDRIAGALSERDFYRSDHGAIFRAIERLANAGQLVDCLLLCESMPAKDLERAGGAAYLLTLANNTPSAANIRRYAEIVREHAIRRELQAAANTIIARAYGDPLADCIEHAQASVLAVTESRSTGGPRKPAEFVAAIATEIEARAAHPDQLRGLETGFVDLDRYLDGLRPGDLIVPAARPNVGKTIFGMNIAEHVSIDCERSVLFFSLEMSSQSLTRRLIASAGRLPLWRMRDGKVEDWGPFERAKQKLSAAPLYIDDGTPLTISDLCARARSFKRRHGLDLIVVDYLQLLTAPGAENRTQEVARISAGLKSLAKQLSVPVIAISQLNRAVMARNDKRPTTADLRDSGAIEQDADVILLLYRDELYNEDSPDRGTAEIIIGKHREGELGTVRLQFSPQLARFENLAAGWRPIRRVPAAPTSRGFDG
jgi:replicative DNA helicase